MTKPKNIGTCENCQWWITEDTSIEDLPENHGECHVFPPTVDVHKIALARYPLTHATWWCDKWEEDKEDK